MPRREANAALRPAYLLLGDESFFRDRFLARLRRQLPPDTMEFAYTAADLGATAWVEVLAQAQTPSLLALLQVFVLDGAEQLTARGAGDGFRPALAAFVAGAGQPPAAVLVFIARRLHWPADVREMSIEDKSQREKLEALFAPDAEIIPCAQASPAAAAQHLAAEAQSHGWRLDAAAAGLLFEVSGGDLARAACELEKLALYAAGEPITVATVRTLVPEAPATSTDGLWRALSRGDRAAALGALDQVWAAEGEAAAIPLVFQLSRWCRMALIAQQARARDRQRLYQVLPPGLRPPSFLADAVLALAQGAAPSQLRAALDRLERADVALRSSPLSPQGVIESIVCQWDTPAAGQGSPRAE